MLSNTSSRPVLALLCGLLCDEDIWREVIAARTAEVDVRVFSFPGFSSIADMAEHVLASVQGRFAVAGHSMGGRVALEIVRRSAGRVTGIALLNTGVHPPAAHETASRGRLVSLARSAGMTALAAEWLPPMLSQTGPVRADVRARLVAMVERCSPDSFAAQIRALLTRPDAAPILAGLRIPALLLSATGDTWSPPAQHQAMRELCPRAELIILPEAGHMLPVEQPAAVAAALDSWLARVGRDDWRSAAGKRDAADAADADIVRACTQRIHHYAQLNDAGAIAELCQMFTEDAVFARPSDPDNPIHGRAGIRASFEARPPRRTLHVIFNVKVVVESSTRARATSDVILITADTAAATVPILTRFDGSFSDVLHRVGNDWLFASRRGQINSKCVL
jgi:pimeloyl-ACP methyl ester carboxylesterase/ketosteroid isomerase-like protein